MTEEPSNEFRVELHQNVPLPSPAPAPMAMPVRSLDAPGGVGADRGVVPLRRGSKAQTLPDAVSRR